MSNELHAAIQNQNSEQNYFYHCFFCFVAILIPIQLIYAW